MNHNFVTVNGKKAFQYIVLEFCAEKNENISKTNKMWIYIAHNIKINC